nr:class I SAM-dependent methyltransferase [uncultured Sphingomonas sp.]
MRHPDAWAEYWREMAVVGAGCAPGSPGIAAATARLWREHGGTLPPRADVLDLATGNGAVLQHLRDVRPKARLVGIDSAPDLGGGADKRLTLKSGVRMEEVPFADGSFDSVTSQFGYEYGDTAAIAREVARLLRPGGSVRLLIHHLDSPVVAQGQTRREQLRWALEINSPLAKAMNFAAARMLGAVPLPDSLRQAPALAAKRFGHPSAAVEIMLGMVQVLERGGTDAPALLRRLQGKVTAELARLDALLGAARSEAGIAVLAAELDQAGLTVTSPMPVQEPGGGALFAWLVDARRR